MEVQACEVTGRKNKPCEFLCHENKTVNLGRSQGVSHLVARAAEAPKDLEDVNLSFRRLSVEERRKVFESQAARGREFLRSKSVTAPQKQRGLNFSPKCEAAVGIQGQSARGVFVAKEDDSIGHKELSGWRKEYIVKPGHKKAYKKQSNEQISKHDETLSDSEPQGASGSDRPTTEMSSVKQRIHSYESLFNREQNPPNLSYLQQQKLTKISTSFGPIVKKATPQTNSEGSTSRFCSSRYNIKAVIHGSGESDVQKHPTSSKPLETVAAAETDTTKVIQKSRSSKEEVLVATSERVGGSAPTHQSIFKEKEFSYTFSVRKEGTASKKEEATSVPTDSTIESGLERIQQKSSIWLSRDSQGVSSQPDSCYFGTAKLKSITSELVEPTSVPSHSEVETELSLEVLGGNIALHKDRFSSKTSAYDANADYSFRTPIHQNQSSLQASCQFPATSSPLCDESKDIRYSNTTNGFKVHGGNGYVPKSFLDLNAAGTLQQWALMESDDDRSDSDESSLTTPSDLSQIDTRSFSISLAELRDCGMDWKDDHRKEGFIDRSASLNSNLSVFSVVSLIPAEDLERMLEEVRSLGEETTQHLEDIQVVVLHKEEGSGLGFSIAGGIDQNKIVTVHKVFPNGLAAQEGTLQQGDEVLSINGSSLKEATHKEALRILHKARPSKQAVIVVRKISESERFGMRTPALASGGQYCTVDSRLHSVPADDPAGLVTVELVKDSKGLGFSLEGGRESSQGDRPLTVQKVFLGGPVEFVQPGDEVIRIQDWNVQGLMRLEVWNMIKALPEGPVKLVIRKTKQS
ncbi:uncharacterized protein SI:DKEY-92I15.4 isoform X2 [Latimeria chalumnae]|uniref:uncharacterized protein SI:DKEY-92I15.4 isoform X2 n=1 Tax=Latimeria chalumnae TaxID=7897 RepID=UPI0003C13760|nr:PREDICTED: uncharacterized protein LOC102353489 isoform X2 [Latimeria chalumnae]|eukprot:XP_014350094.1 PREDICTED: uncharacterized protein LOC102353489 isoform X2 [Latimeria chalumnae]